MDALFDGEDLELAELKFDESPINWDEDQNKNDDEIEDNRLLQEELKWRGTSWDDSWDDE